MNKRVIVRIVSCLVTGVLLTGCMSPSGQPDLTASGAAAGAIVGSIVVAAANGNAISISVTGSASLPGSFTLDPTSIPLGDLVVGATVPVTVTVTATDAITGLTTGVQGTRLKLNTTGSTCTGTLAAGATCTVAATFTATKAVSGSVDAIVFGEGTYRSMILSLPK